MFGWKRFLSDLGWAMAVADPSCYAYYLARPADGIDGHRRPHVSTSRGGPHQQNVDASARIDAMKERAKLLILAVTLSPRSHAVARQIRRHR
jgi:hypothetical protein